MIEKTTELYEILYRFKDGKLSGCHQVDLVIVQDTDTGEVFSRIEGVAQPIDQNTAAILIGEQTAGLIEQVAALKALVLNLNDSAQTQ